MEVNPSDDTTHEKRVLKLSRFEAVGALLQQGSRQFLSLDGFRGRTAAFIRARIAQGEVL